MISSLTVRPLFCFWSPFFPSTDPLISTLAAFATYAVGFLARPLGGIVFGHIGDKVGRKKALVITILIVGLGTFCIGLLPTYEKIGIWAPVLLILIRVLQGFGVGGEQAGAVLMTAEYSVPRAGAFCELGTNWCTGWLPVANGPLCLTQRRSLTRGDDGLRLAYSLSAERTVGHRWPVYSLTY
jgi:MFS family permease